MELCKFLYFHLLGLGKSTEWLIVQYELIELKSSTTEIFVMQLMNK